MSTIKRHIRSVCATLVLVPAFAAAIFTTTVAHAPVASIPSSHVQQASCGGLNLPVCGVTVPHN